MKQAFYVLIPECTLASTKKLKYNFKKISTKLNIYAFYFRDKKLNNRKMVSVISKIKNQTLYNKMLT